MDYAAYRGYSDWTATNLYYGTTFDWATLVTEIDADRPLMLTVDSSGDGVIDHSVTGIGYEDRGVNGLWYACFRTWDEAESPWWYQFRPVSASYGWGVYNATLVMPGVMDPGVIPVPGALLLGAIGACFGVLGTRADARRRRRRIAGG